MTLTRLSLTRSKPGTYPVSVQYRQDTVAGDESIKGAFDFWNLTVERIAA